MEVAFFKKSVDDFKASKNLLKIDGIWTKAALRKR